MTKLILITTITPYKENRGGATALPYYLMTERPQDIDIIVYSYNLNKLPAETIAEVEKALHIKILLLKEPRWMAFIKKKQFTPLRLFLKYPINYYLRLSRKEHDQILSRQPDAVWLYGQELSGISRQLKTLRRLHTAPDCYSLHWYRRLALRNTLSDMNEYLRCVVNYRKHYRMERQYDTSGNIIYHFVGLADKQFALEINPRLTAVFVPHPHYKLPSLPHATTFHKPRIRLLIAGRYDLYSREAADDFIDALVHLSKEEKQFFNSRYEFTILGKGWQRIIQILQQSGIETRHIAFAQNYIDEIVRHDIQINPISLGTGTKGKVLDALAAGLLVVATPYALENIAVNNGQSCIEYHNGAELIRILIKIPDNPSYYEQIAYNGQQEVLRHHNPKAISQKLFSLLFS